LVTIHPRNCQIDFNHLVKFINVKNDQIFNSKVTVELFHNEELIRSFVFPTGDHLTNRIYIGEAINLRKGDKVYFLFKLLQQLRMKNTFLISMKNQGLP